MKLSANFSKAEFEKSMTATRNNIDNSMTEEHLANAIALCENVLQKVREHFGRTGISSGYRSSGLNAKIGGSSKSQHSKGEAADFECPGVDNLKVAEWIRDTLEFDQLILEGYTPGDPNSGWIHVSYKEEGNRKQCLTASFATGKAVYSHGLG